MSGAITKATDEQIRKTVESIQDPDTVPAFHNGYYTLTPDELRRSILAMRPQAESKTYADGTTATGVAPLPDVSPAVPVVSDERLLREWDRVSHIAEAGSRRLAFARAILAMRPAVEPMTPEQREVLAALVVGACEHKTRTLLALRAIEATEAQYGIGITAKAEATHQPTKEADKP